MQAISRIVDRLGPCTFLEAGCGGPIIPMARNALPHAQVQAEHTFIAINGKDPVRSLADATVTLWKSGQPNVQFWLFHQSQRASYFPVTLPPYQFEKDRHWVEYVGLSGDRSNKTDDQAPARSGRCPHCLKNIDDFSYIAQDESQSQGKGSHVFTIDTRSKRYQDLVKGHVVAESPICPAGMYLELASHAVASLREVQMMTTSPEITVEAFDIKAPLGLETQRSVKLTLTTKTAGAWGFELSSTKNSDKLSSHATGIISLHDSNSSINDEQHDKDKWAHASSLLELDTDTEALRGNILYKVFGKMVTYSPAYRGMRYLVGKNSEGAGDIAMSADHLDAIARTPNDGIANPVVMDNFLQVPGAFVHSLRATDYQEEDDTFSYICTGMASVGPLNGLQGDGKYRAYTKVIREDSKEAVLDVFVFDKQSKKIIWLAKGLKFSRVLRASLVKVLARANPDMELKEQPAVPSKPVTSLAPKSPLQVTPAAPPKKSSRGNEDSSNILSGVQEVLSKCLDLPVEEITKQALLEDLGLDSLVGSEVLAHISDKFNTQISTDDFATVTDVASLCRLISSRVDGGAAATSGVDDEDQGPDSVLETADDTALEWQNTIFEILSRSLDLPVAEIQMDSSLEDLGADSLVAGEIIGNLNQAFSLDIPSTEFASIVDVVSLCKFIADALGVGSAHTPTTSSSSASDGRSSPITGTPATPDTGTTTPTVSEPPTPIKGNTGPVHTAFQQIRRRIETHAKDTKFIGYWDQIYPQQLSTVTAFINEAFDKLGCPIRTFRQGEKLPALQGTLAKWYREVPRLWEILEEAGVVEKTANGFLRGLAPLDNDASNKPAQELSTKLISNFPHYASTHGLLDLLGPHLAECLNGKADPVSLLFGSANGRSLLENYYANAPDLRAATLVLGDFLSAAIRAQASDGRPFRVLEIGAGTGGTTKHLVPLLQATGLPFTYTFTELSGSLLARAKTTTFKGIAGMDFRKLNIEEDPPADLLGRYHVVVSTNCVHATRNLRRSLANIRKLVRPVDGCVALSEVTQKVAWYDLVWGLLDGWWLFDDDDRTYPLQNPWAWERAMRDAGFAHVDWSEGASRESRTVRVICGFAAELERPCPAKATSMLLHRGIAASPGDRNLFLVPDGFGSGAVFGALQPLLGGIKDVSVYALNSPFVKNKPGSDQPFPAIEELAAIYVAEIQRRQPEGPYLVGGYSIGGVVAYEAVRQLLEHGYEVETLFLLDTACPTFASFLPDSVVEYLDSIAHIDAVDENNGREKTRGRLVASDHFTLSRQQLLAYKASRLPRGKIPRAVLVSAREGVDKQDRLRRPEVLPRERRLTEWFLDDRIDDGALGWDELLGSMRVVRADGNHFSMMMPPAVSPLVS